MLFETPQRQLIPFSPFDPSLGDANMLIMAKSGGGKTFMAQMFLLMLARANPLISILERGDSYQPLVDLMGGRSIAVDLEGRETLNPWDLPPGETEPTKDKIAFLKNLVLHMIGHGPALGRYLARQPARGRLGAHLQTVRRTILQPHSHLQ